MSLLTPGGLPCTDRLGTPIYTDFRNMLQVSDILQQPCMQQWEKLYFALRLLYGCTPPQPKAALNELMWFYHCGAPPPKAAGAKVFCFEEDAPCLYAAFLQAYRINLADETTHLHWWAFTALLASLPENTALMRRIADRCLDTSRMKGEERRYYEARKKAAALKGRPHAPTGKQNRQQRLTQLYNRAQAALEQTDD